MVGIGQVIEDCEENGAHSHCATTYREGWNDPMIFGE